MSETKATKQSSEKSNGKDAKVRFAASQQVLGKKVKEFIDRERNTVNQFPGAVKKFFKRVTHSIDEEGRVMRTLIGKTAPDFKATAVFGDEFKEVQLSQFSGKYVLLFFYPLDFTFVCPTELHAFQERLNDFQKRGVEILGCSVDSQFSHLAWLKTAKEKGGIKGIQYGLISDLGGGIANQYGVLSDEGIAYRAQFLMDQHGIVRHQLVNDLPLGRNVDEALRMVDALQHHEKNGEVCPANWKKGEKALHASPEGVVKYFDALSSN